MLTYYYYFIFFLLFRFAFFVGIVIPSNLGFVLDWAENKINVHAKKNILFCVKKKYVWLSNCTGRVMQSLDPFIWNDFWSTQFLYCQTKNEMINSWRIYFTFENHWNSHHFELIEIFFFSNLTTQLIAVTPKIEFKIWAFSYKKRVMIKREWILNLIRTHFVLTVLKLIRFFVLCCCCQKTAISMHI